MSPSIFWKSLPLFFTAAAVMLTVPAHAGVLEDARKGQSQYEKQHSKKTTRSHRTKRRAIEQAPAENDQDSEFNESDDQRFGVHPGSRYLGRMQPQTEPANWQPDDFDNRYGWDEPRDAAERDADDQRLASVETQPDVDNQVDKATRDRQSWDENNQQWADPDTGTRPIARQEVAWNGKEAAGTVVINTLERRLYFVLGNNRAIQYGVGVGKPGFEWGGIKNVTRKEEWPDWRPPEMMIRRRPDLPRFMPGGPTNPMGARAMYLGSTLYRIHGSNEPETIGAAVSSGCIRMINADVIDLYNRVKVGAKVVVLR